MNAVREHGPTTHTGQLLYGYETIAAFLGMTPREVRHQVDTNGLPAFKLGRSVAVRVQSLLRWLDEQEAKPRGLPPRDRSTW